MEAKNATVQGAIDGVKQFVIPVFQRDCKWDEDNWLRLGNDTAGASAAGALTSAERTMSADAVRPCSQVAQCDCHAVCGERPDNPMVWRRDCWAVDGKAHSWPEQDAVLRKNRPNEFSNTP